MTDQGLVEKVGFVAAEEFARVPDQAKPELLKWIDKLPTLTDEELFVQAQMAILGSALGQRFRGDWSEEECRCGAVHHESNRRHRLAHAEGCPSPTIYSRAHAKVMREQGHRPRPDGVCTCPALTS